MKIGFVLFDNYHQKRDIGSSRLRGRYLINHMPEAEEFIQGKKYDVIVFQKTYWKEYIRSFKGIKILDICDPDWLEGLDIVNLLKNVDAVTVSTEKLQEELQQFTDTPVYYIPDRLDFNKLPKPKVHTKEDRICTWFGYSHNISCLEPAMVKIKNDNMKLVVITDSSFSTGVCDCEWIRWKIDTAYKDIQKGDFVLLPDYKFGKYAYKSNNKDVLSWALGMPVVKTAKEFEKFQSLKERQKESAKRLKEVKKDYDVKLSVKQLREIINAIKKKKSKHKRADKLEKEPTKDKPTTFRKA